MVVLNEHIGILNDEKIYDIGTYVLGKDIPVGEYYLWGECIQYSYIRGKEEYSSHFKGESYDIFDDGDVLELLEGRMIHIDNLKYFFEKTDVLYPGHIYRVGREIPRGYYLFRFDEAYALCDGESYNRWSCSQDSDNNKKCKVEMHTNYAVRCYQTVSKKSGCVLWDGDVKHIKINNGIAEYFGVSKFEEDKVIRECEMSDDAFVKEGALVFDSNIMDMRVYQKGSEKIFLGQVPIEVLDYALYSIGSDLKWIVNMIPLSFQIPRNIRLKFTDSNNFSNNYTVDVEGIFYRTERETRRSWYHMEVPLPEILLHKEICVELQAYNGQVLGEMLINNAGEQKQKNISRVMEICKKDYMEIKELLAKYKGIDVEYELDYLKSAPDLIKEIKQCLCEIEDKRNTFKEKTGGEKEITFTVPATYDKKFYCASKLADSALRVETNETDTVYEVTFSGGQIEEIEVMSYMYFDSEDKQQEENRAYLIANSFVFYRIHAVQSCIDNLNNCYGYSGIVTRSVLSRLIKVFNKDLQKRVDDIYVEISKEGRVQARWGNEYRLFMMVSKYVPSAYYQYRCDWLGMQSYDIYLEEYKMAIEYQGQQHYEAISLFGGEEGLRATQERDEKKRRLSKEHGITMLEWGYSVLITEESVREFLQDNGVNIEIVRCESEGKTHSTSKVNMAPVVERKKPPKRVSVKRDSGVYIVCYNMDGMLYKKYRTIGEAAEELDVSSTSISKALRGERNTAAGYIWRKYPNDSLIPEVIEVEFNVNLTNSGQARKVAKIDEKGEVIEEYLSIAEAAKKHEMDYRIIQRLAKKEQGWKYVE